MPAAGFDKWHVNEDGTKTPFYITMADQPVFGFAGLWDRSVLAEIHNAKQRMPAILAAEDIQAWHAGNLSQYRAHLQERPSVLGRVARIAVQGTLGGAGRASGGDSIHRRSPRVPARKWSRPIEQTPWPVLRGYAQT